MTSLASIAAAILIATPVLAEYGDTRVQSDLNKNGTMETYEILDLEDDGIVDLYISEPGQNTVIARDIAWKGGIGQQPYLTLNPAGSVQLVSLNEAIGRNRWHLVLTIAYRRGAYRVAGYTYDWYDTLNLENAGLCDLNLLSGSGHLTKGQDGARQLIRASLPAMPVTEFKDTIPVPAECGLE